MKAKLTRAQYDEIVNCYEEAVTLPRNSPGAWHNALIQAVRDAGYEVVNYEQARDIARATIEEGVL